MDQLAQHHFETVLHAKYLTERGDAFQVFFSRVMSKSYPGDFEPTRPWGNVGDRKCDGYLRSTRSLYQCYAPNELALAETKTKIAEDFDGALAHQKAFWDEWVFVHNSLDGRLATDISIHIAELRSAHTHLRFRTMSYEDLRALVFKLPEHEIVSLLGPRPTARAFENIAFSDIAPLLEKLDAINDLAPTDVRPTPAGKVEFNRLGQASASLLKLGMAYASRVENYLTSHPDKTYGDRVTARFNQEYRRLFTQGETPDAIFSQLFIFTHGPMIHAVERMTSSYAILAYMFEECEIFERPPDESHTK